MIYNLNGIFIDLTKLDSSSRISSEFVGGRQYFYFDYQLNSVTRKCVTLDRKNTEDLRKDLIKNWEIVKLYEEYKKWDVTII